MPEYVLRDTPSITSLSGTWAVTDLLHPAVLDYRPACQECLDLIGEAITEARATGSRSATWTDGIAHWVTVARVHAVVETTP